MRASWPQKTLLIAATAAIASGLCVIAQVGGGAPTPKDGRPGTGGPPGPPGRGQRPRPPLELVLDANGDGAIDAAEIANAATALKKLDKNGDGKLTADEYRPPRPPWMEGEGPGGEAPDRR